MRGLDRTSGYALGRGGGWPFAGSSPNPFLRLDPCSCRPGARPGRPQEGLFLKLLRYGKPGKERPGVLDADGKIRDLSGHVGDIAGAVLAPASLKKLAKIDPASLP